MDSDAIGAGSNCCSQHVASERTNLRAHDCAFGHSCGPDPDSMEAERTAVVEPGWPCKELRIGAQAHRDRPLPSEEGSESVESS